MCRRALTDSATVLVATSKRRLSEAMPVTAPTEPGDYDRLIIH